MAFLPEIVGVLRKLFPFLIICKNFLVNAPGFVFEISKNTDLFAFLK